MNEASESPPPEGHGSGGDVCRDVASSPDTTTSPYPYPLPPGDDPRVLDAQNADIDVVCDSAVAEARAWAARLRAIDRMRCRSIALVASRPGADSPRAWTVQVIARRELQFEIVGALRLPWPTAARLIDQAEMLSTDLPSTLQALERGSISWAHATAMADQATNVPEHARRAFEDQLLPLAETLTAPQFRDAARRLREALHPDSLQERRDDAFTRRNIRVTPDLDGMATLTADIAAETALAINDRLTAIARGHDLPDDDRTLTQRKADVFTDLLLTGDTLTTPDGVEHSINGVQAKVLITVPVETLLATGAAGVGSSTGSGFGSGSGSGSGSGLANGSGTPASTGTECAPGSLRVAPLPPATLDGYGPISDDTARLLAAHAPSFTRILTHPVTSAILDFDRSRYAVPHDLKLVLRVRDVTCRIIGCRQPAAHCDIDHTIPYSEDGTTCADNLAHLCRAHHNLKHHTRIQMRNLGDGTIQWTSAAGRTYFTHPAGDITTPRPQPDPPPEPSWDTAVMPAPMPF
jgi:hypothetical protein